MSYARRMSRDRSVGSGWTRRDVLRLGAVGAAVALLGCGPSLPAPPRPLRLGTGPDGAVYREIGAAFVDVLREQWPGARPELVPTQAAVENARLLSDREVELAFVNIDVARLDSNDAVALARVFDSVIHVVVPDGAGIGSFEDLDGRRVAGGLPQSGTRFLVDRIVEVTGVRPELVDLSQAASVAALRSGDVDAVVSLTGMPTPAVQAMSAGGGVRFLDLGEVAAELARAHPLEYYTVTIPSSMYPPMQAAATVAVPTLLATVPEFGVAAAETVTRLFVENGPELSQVRPEAGQINARNGAVTVPVPLHPGAARYFRSTKE